MRTDFVGMLSQPKSLMLLPMIYVAWADGELEAEEWSTIRLWASVWLTPAQQDWVVSWTDPSDPPTAEELAELLGRLKMSAGELDRSGLDSLVDVGMEMARHMAVLRGETEVRWNHEELTALRDIQVSLGLNDPEALVDLGLKTGDSGPGSPGVESPFDVEKVRELLDGKYVRRKQAMRELLSHPLFVHEYEQPKERERERIWSLCKFAAERGLGKLAFPGVTTDSDLGEFVAAFEYLGFFDLNLSVKYGVQCGLFGGSIYFLGSKRHHEAYLPQVASMELPGCFAMTEVGHGSNVRQLETTATYRSADDTFVIHTPSPTAAKEWIGNAATHARMATVFAQLRVGDAEHGVHALLVPIRDEEGNALPGVTLSDCGPKMGLNGVDNGRIVFDQVAVPAENLLDRYAAVINGRYESSIASSSKRFFTMLGTLVGGRIAVASAALSSAKVALTIAIRYGNRRRQFGATPGHENFIMDYPSHQLRLIPRLAESYAMTFALAEVVDLHVEGKEENARRIEVIAAAMKVVCTSMTTSTIQTCREACGGQGYRATNRFAALKANSDVFTTFEGDNTVLAQLVAKGLLTQFQQQFHDSKFFGILRYLAQSAVSAVTERNPVIQRLSTSEHLRDPSFHHDALSFREDQLLSSAARRLASRVAQGMAAFDAFVDIQDHLIALCVAHAENEIYGAFSRALDNVEEPSLGAPLRRLAALYALSKVNDHAGWFLENEMIDGSKAAAIRREVNVLCRELRPDVEKLVDAFDIPSSCIAAPIAGLG